MGLLSRGRSRVREEGLAKALQYGVFVGADSVKTFFRDSYLDLRYSHRVLHGNDASEFKHLGANDVYHTAYSAMPLIFGNIGISPDDVLVDVGCGKGRVINYWLSRNYNNLIIGLEIDPVIAAKTTRQFANRPNVQVVAGDAVEHLPANGTIFYFYNPFNENKVASFEDKLRQIAGNNKVKVVYYNPRSLSVFENGAWSIKRINFAIDFGVKRWGRLNKYHELAIVTRIIPGDR